MASIIGFSNYRKLGSLRKVIVWYSIFLLAIQGSASVLALKSMNNMSLLRIYTFVDLIMIYAFYDRLFKGFVSRLYPFLLVASGLVLMFTHDFSFEAKGFDSFNLTVKSSIAIIFSVSGYVFIMNYYVVNDRQKKLNGIDWINSGIFLYNSSGLLLFYFGKTIFEFLPEELSRYTWLIHSFFAFVMYVCFTVGLWRSPKR